MKHLGVAMMLVLFITCLLLVSVSLVGGQLDPQPSRDPVVFKAQLAEFILEGRRLMREIQALPVDDSVPVDPRVHHHAHQVYVLIRVGLHGMELAIQRQTYQDPVFNLAYKKVEAAWNLSRFPVDNTGLPRSEYIGRSVRDLTRAIQLVNQALIILP
jgi:hypothetical protein